MSRGARLTVVGLTIPLVVFVFLGGYLGQAVTREDDPYRHLRIFEDVVSLIASNYVEPTDLDDVMRGALRGLADGLDRDSAYLPAEDVARLQAEAPLPAGAIGVEIISQYYVQIIAPRDGSPAAEAGLAPGDYIRTIDGETTRRMSAIEAERRLRGEPGSTVALSLLRGSTQEPYDIELTRVRLDAAAVSHRLVGTGSGYVRVAEFSDGVADALDAAVDALIADGATRLLVDVRSAAGGSFEAGIAAARLFVAEGPLLRRTEHGGVETNIDATAGDEAHALPVVLLTNPGTAHGAELFVAGLVSAGRAETVGQRTGGRASLQRLVPLPDGTGLWLSWARYLTGSGDPIHAYGVPPGVEVDTPFVELGEPRPEGDPIFDRGLEHLETLS